MRIERERRWIFQSHPFFYPKQKEEKKSLALSRTQRTETLTKSLLHHPLDFNPMPWAPFSSSISSNRCLSILFNFNFSHVQASMVFFLLLFSLFRRVRPFIDNLGRDWFVYIPSLIVFADLVLILRTVVFYVCIKYLFLWFYSIAILNIGKVLGFQLTSVQYCFFF